MKKNTLKWSPAVPVRKADNILSSKARENGQTGFTPSYESHPKEYMNYIMSNEYMRIWFKERAAYEIDVYSKGEAQASATKDIKRRYVQRYVSKNKEKVKILPPIKLKRFANISSKTDQRRNKND